MGRCHWGTVTERQRFSAGNRLTLPCPADRGGTQFRAEPVTIYQRRAQRLLREVTNHQRMGSKFTPSITPIFKKLSVRVHIRNQYGRFQLVTICQRRSPKPNGQSTKFPTLTHRKLWILPRIGHSASTKRLSLFYCPLNI